MIFTLLRIAFLVMARIPLPLGQCLGRALGAVFSWIPTSRTAAVHENIRLSFPGSPYEKKPERLVRRVYAHLGQMLFEIPHILRLNRENLRKYVTLQEIENLEHAIAKGKGIFVLSAHLGNWEWLVAAVTLLFSDTAIVVRTIDFEPFERYMQKLRSRFGTQIISKQKAMRRILGAIKRKKIVGILLDQNVDWYEGVFVPFFGRLACTNKGLALLALKTGAPVVPVFCLRQPDGRLRIVFEPELEIIRTGDELMDVEENTALFTAVIEKFVRRAPDQWFWLHRRWKTRPYCRIPGSHDRVNDPSSKQQTES